MLYIIPNNKQTFKNKQINRVTDMIIDICNIQEHPGTYKQHPGTSIRKQGNRQGNKQIM